MTHDQYDRLIVIAPWRATAVLDGQPRAGRSYDMADTTWPDPPTVTVADLAAWDAAARGSGHDPARLAAAEAKRARRAARGW